ncbi:hypothetical protein FA13DRAFT_1716197 [Coprinellus micaceus]|uniref:Uncharacterized protein n=1 Tax=Coprinellus micaceus TaxID=71717 RepID=A0A4Y7SKL4_COPMI|nr:hypothetical protein FA13DRAFT_1716197 [Coprinellus micaceus]
MTLWETLSSRACLGRPWGCPITKCKPGCPIALSSHTRPSVFGCDVEEAGSLTLTRGGHRTNGDDKTSIVVYRNHRRLGLEMLEAWKPGSDSGEWYQERCVDAPTVGVPTTDCGAAFVCSIDEESSVDGDPALKSPVFLLKSQENGVWVGGGLAVGVGPPRVVQGGTANGDDDGGVKGADDGEQMLGWGLRKGEGRAELIPRSPRVGWGIRLRIDDDDDEKRGVEEWWIGTASELVSKTPEVARWIDEGGPARAAGVAVLDSSQNCTRKGECGGLGGSGCRRSSTNSDESGEAEEAVKREAKETTIRSLRMPSEGRDAGGRHTLRGRPSEEFGVEKRRRLTLNPSRRIMGIAHINLIGIVEEEQIRRGGDRVEGTAGVEFHRRIKLIVVGGGGSNQGKRKELDTTQTPCRETVIPRGRFVPGGPTCPNDRAESVRTANKLDARDLSEVTFRAVTAHRLGSWSWLWLKRRPPGSESGLVTTPTVDTGTDAEHQSTCPAISSPKRPKLNRAVSRFSTPNPSSEQKWYDDIKQSRSTATSVL